MAIETKHFIVAGTHYRTKTYSAVFGLKILGEEDEANPVEVLKHTEVEREGEWSALVSAAALNEHLYDPFEIMTPFQVLEQVIGMVKDINFGFLATWKGAKIPNRFISQSDTIKTAYSEPIISNLIQADKANLRDLEEYYSVHDAFKMFDIVIVSTVNKALAQEEAEKAAKQNRK
jgi:ribosomal protein S8